jgi:hypothetical protein
MKAELISYTLGKAKPNQRIAIHRLLYGYNDVSNNGHYRYQREGLIESLSGKKINRGVFIIPKKHKSKILSILKKNKAVIKSIPITV